MKDPLGELEDSLKYMFELQTKRTNRYISPAVQKLKNALDRYKGSSVSLQELVVAIKLALPTIEKYTDAYVVKNKMDVLAATKGKAIAWDTHVQIAAVMSTDEEMSVDKESISPSFR